MDDQVLPPDTGIEPEHQVWTGPCIGGPMDTMEGYSRYPKGFLLVNRPLGRVWLYDWIDADGTFLVREAEGAEMIDDPAADKNRYRAAEEPEFDVIAAPWIDEAPVTADDDENEEAGA